MINKIARHMYDNDPFSQWMGMNIIESEPGFCKLEMTVRDEMCNGFAVAHGGITYSLADSALAFAANAYGQMAMSIETTIAHTAKVVSGDKLTAEAKEVNKTRRVGLYTVVVTNQNGALVAHFRGTVYRKEKEWDV